MRRIAREGLIVGVGQALVVAARFVTVWWLTRLLQPAAFGEVALIQGLAALGIAFLCSPLLHAGLRFHPEALRDGRVGTLHAILRPLLTRTSALTAAVLIGGAFIWKGVSGNSIAPLALFTGLCIVIPDALRLYETNTLNASRRQAAYTVWNVADAFARPVGAALAVGVWGSTPAAALTGMLVATVGVQIVGARTLVRERSARGEDGENQELRAGLMRFARPLVPLAIMTWIVGLADRYVLAATGGSSVAGLYAAVYGLGSQGFLALGLFGLTVFRPLYFAAVDGGNERRARRVLAIWIAALLAGSAIGVIMLGVFSAPIAALCLGPEFRSAAPLLPWIGAAYAFQTLQTVFEVMIYAHRRTARLISVQAAGAITAVVLYAILIPWKGAFGAALATLGSFVVSCLVAAFMGRTGSPAAAIEGPAPVTVPER